MITAEEFIAEFSKPKSRRAARYIRKAGMCQTCRGQQFSTITESACPDCDATGLSPERLYEKRKTHSDSLFKGELNGYDKALHDSLVDQGFMLVGRCTHAGNVLDYTYFDADGIKVSVDYRHAKTPRKFSLVVEGEG